MSGKLRLDVREVDLAEVVEAALESVAPAGYQTHVVKPVEADELVTVVAGLAGRDGAARGTPGA